jgi:uncharacterized protein YqjF (DUF2071 family)
MSKNRSARDTPAASDPSGWHARAGDRRPVGYQRWRDLLFLHWSLPPEALRPLVPPALELDLHAGRAYVTLIPFLIAESRPAGVPPSLAIRLLETNLRTYVRAPDGQAGIYFFSLDASSRLAVAAARVLYGLPYFPAAMSMWKEGARVEYVSRRRGAGDVRLEVAWSIGARLGPAAAGTREHFLVERYALYVARLGGLYRARVRHEPYPLWEAAVEHLSETLQRAAGLPAPAEPPLGHYSPGVDVEIFWRERVKASPSP